MRWLIGQVLTFEKKNQSIGWILYYLGQAKKEHLRDCCNCIDTVFTYLQVSKNSTLRTPSFLRVEISGIDVAVRSLYVSRAEYAPIFCY